MKIRRGDRHKVAPNFFANELYTPGKDYPDVITLPDNMAKALQAMRDWYRSKGFVIYTRINSTFRTFRQNKDAGGKKHSMHLPKSKKEPTKGFAVDSQPYNKEYPKRHKKALAAFNNEIVNKGPIYWTLRRLGVAGFGLYNTFTHLDFRTEKHYRFRRKDKFGGYALWDKRKKKSSILILALLLGAALAITSKRKQNS